MYGLANINTPIIGPNSPVLRNPWPFTTMNYPLNTPMCSLPGLSTHFTDQESQKHNRIFSGDSTTETGDLTLEPLPRSHLETQESPGQAVPSTRKYQSPGNLPLVRVDYSPKTGLDGAAEFTLSITEECLGRYPDFPFDNNYSAQGSLQSRMEMASRPIIDPSHRPMPADSNDNSVRIRNTPPLTEKDRFVLGSVLSRSR
ncbi:hypothetical protein P691DRAFT_240054 [Macrolepiota fuliginosa MF-IS2]|uniref:Uncharacterized protein n=1 Tax=Macrolepiota fuliginosa MF-IS2 TaxID=1400762 RepID=A0A9P6BZ85_9AGAR|nr:hypothetical protein P691DRAFT_240054 [Macrolepiota fuliginosa MF-IS2]